MQQFQCKIINNHRNYPVYDETERAQKHCIERGASSHVAKK